MQYTLFPEIYRQQLNECSGFLEGPLKIVERILKNQLSDPLIKSIKADQYEMSVRRAKERNMEYRGCGVNRHMAADIVVVFCVVRAFYPDIYGDRGYEMMKESRSLHETLAKMEVGKMPGRSTIYDQLTGLSETSLNHFWQLILRVAKLEELDDFTALTMDSTAIEADSAWPVDSQILSHFAEKIIEILRAILSGLSSRERQKFPLKNLENHARSIRSLHIEICNAKGKKGAKFMRRRLYLKLLKAAEKTEARLNILLKRLDDHEVHESLLRKFDRVCEQFYDKILTTQRRFGFNREDCGAYEPERVHSVSDPDAAFIKKGGRETVFGYRPTFGTSASGFISSFLLETGNTSDSKAFSKVLENHRTNCEVTPLLVSTDDGYASGDNLDLAVEQGVKIVSFSGAKGRKILGEETYDREEFKMIRSQRSAIEGTISNLKNVHDLKRFSVHGIKRIRQELLINIIGFNLERIVQLLRSETETMAA